MDVVIGRASGPSTDRVCKSSFDEHEIDIVKDTLAIVNRVSNNKERWYIEIDGELGVIPESNT